MVFLSCKLLSAAQLLFLHPSNGCHGHSLNWPSIIWSNLICSRALDSSLVLLLTSCKCCTLLLLMGSGKVPLTTVPVFHIGSESHGPNILTIHKLPWSLMPLKFSPITQHRASLLTPSLYVCHPRNTYKISTSKLTLGVHCNPTIIIIYVMNVLVTVYIKQN